MKYKIAFLITSYQSNIDNILWHLKANGNFLSDIERKGLLQRVQDFGDFIEQLRTLEVYS